MIVKEILLICDGKNCATGTFANGDVRYMTALKQRYRARLEGWKRIRGKDYCSTCALKLDWFAGKVVVRL